jgi:hypothetical protein
MLSAIADGMESASVKPDGIAALVGFSGFLQAKKIMDRNDKKKIAFFITRVLAY